MGTLEGAAASMRTPIKEERVVICPITPATRDAGAWAMAGQPALARALPRARACDAAADETPRAVVREAIDFL